MQGSVLVCVCACVCIYVKGGSNLTRVPLTGYGYLYIHSFVLMRMFGFLFSESLLFTTLRKL